MRAYLPFMWNDSVTHMHIWYTWCHFWCEGGAFFCMGLIFRKLWQFLFIFSAGFTSFVVLFLFLYWSPSSLCVVSDAISSKIDQVFSINPSANIFVFGDFPSIIRTGWPILVEKIDLVTSVIIFLSQMNLLRLLTSLIGSLTVTVKGLLFWVSFFLLILVFVLQ